MFISRVLWIHFVDREERGVLIFTGERPLYGNDRYYN